VTNEAWPPDADTPPPLEPWVDQVNPDDELERQISFNLRVTEAADRLRISDAARERIAAEKATANPAPPFDAGTLGEVLARPPSAPYRVEDLIPHQAGTLLTAARKAGKTTTELNLARCLLTGEDFLGRFGVRPLVGNVAILNFEVSGATLARWAHEHQIDQDRLLLVNLRGRRNPLPHPQDRAALAGWLRKHDIESLIVDPFGRAYTGKSQNDPGEVTAWLVDLDVFARDEAGALDLLLTAHAGWNAERTRGASALEDWADSIMWLTRDPDDDTQRYLRAEGRDVLVDEDRLLYDSTTRSLALAGTGSRKKTRDTRKVDDLAVFVRRAAGQIPGASTAQLVKEIRKMGDAPTFQDRDVSKAAQIAAERGFLRIEDNGPGKAKQHYPSTPSNPVQPPSTDAPSQPRPPRLYMDGVGVGAPEQQQLPDGVTLDGLGYCPECLTFNCRHREAS